MTLTRIQCGIGILTFTAAHAGVEALHLGCAYQLRSGQSSVVQPFGGATVAPPRSARPLIIGRPGPTETLTLDLVQSRSIERLAIYAFSGQPVQPNGSATLVATTFAGTRVELPLDRPPSQHVTVLMSLYNLAGEFVLRAELDVIPGTVRDACAAYGFDRITWLDAHTPLV